MGQDCRGDFLNYNFAALDGTTKVEFNAARRVQRPQYHNTYKNINRTWHGGPTPLRHTPLRHTPPPTEIETGAGCLAGAGIDG